MPLLQGFAKGTQFLDNSGNPLARGTLSVYEANTSTLATLTSNGSTAAPNPITLDGSGRLVFGVWVITSVDIVIKDSSGSTVANPQGLVPVNTETIYATQFGVRADDTTDDSNALNDAITEALASDRELILPRGTMRVDSSILVATGGGHTDALKMSGRGMYSTIIRPTGNFSALNIDGSGTNSQFMHGGFLRDFAIAPTSAGGTGQHGIELRSWWYGVIERVRIDGLGGSGIYVPLDTGISTNPDDYASGALTFKHCRLTNNTGWGVYAPGGLAFSGPAFNDCYVGVNALGGYYLACHGFRIEGGACFSNGKNGVVDGPGVMVDEISTSPQVWRIRGVELDNNRTAHIHIKSARGFDVKLNRMNSWETVFNDGVLSPPVHVKLESSSNTIGNGRFIGNQHRSQRSDQTPAASTMHALICYDFGNSATIAKNEVINPNADAADNTTAMTVFSGFNINSRNEAELDTRLHHSGHLTGYVRTRMLTSDNIETTITKLLFDSEHFDIHGLMSSSTYTVPYTGIFHISYALRITGVADGTAITVQVVANSGASNPGENIHIVNGTGEQSITGSMSLYLNSGDTIELWASNNSGSPIAITTGTQKSWLCINGGR